MSNEIEMIASFLRFMNRVRADRLETWSPELKNINKIDLHILLLIQQNPDLNIGDIKKQLDISASTLTSIINRMEKKQYLTRTITNDKRSYSLKLLPEGKCIRTIHDQLLQKIANTMLEALTPQEQQQFITLLDKATTNLPPKGPIR